MIRSPKQISQFKRYQAKGTISAFRTRMQQLIADDEFSKTERRYFSYIEDWCANLLDRWKRGLR